MPNTPIPDDILDDVFKSNASGGGVYLERYGKYTILIEQSIFKHIKDVGRCFITKGQVLASEAIVVQEGPTRDRPTSQTFNEEPHPVGYRFSYTVNWDGKAKMSADGNAKAIVLAIFGMNESKIDEATFKSTFRDLVSDAQPACGLVIQAEVRPKGVDKQDGVPGYYMRVPHWQCLGLPGQGENAWDKVNARRAEINKYLAADEARDAERQARFESSKQGSGGSFLPQNQPPSLPSSIPSIPSIPQVAPPGIPGIPAAADPLVGWEPHPNNTPGDTDPWLWNRGKNLVKRKSDVLAGR